MTNADILIDATTLHASLDAPDLRIFDCAVHLVPAAQGYRAESGLGNYQEAHIPGAGFLDLIQAYSDTTTGLGFSLPDVDDLATAAGASGISNGNRVVLYSSGHMMWATRAWWLLRYLGHDNVLVLNGGLTGWQEAGHPTSAGEDRYPAGRMDPSPRPEMFVDLAGMEAAGVSGACTVNALSSDLYTGSGDFHYGRPGHIPGSLHLHYEDLMDGQHFRPVEAMREVLEGRGVLSAERVVTYCGGGIAATVDGFACHLSGQTNVAVYDGSMSEWVRSGKPLTVGEAP